MTETIVTKNIVIVGDGAVGKTCLLYSYSNRGGFDMAPAPPYVPTIYEKEAFEMLLDNQKHLIKLHDTAGQEDYERLRTVIYKEADCFILCYNKADRTSFDNIRTKWYPELEPYGRPIVLVATKSDLYMTSNSVSPDEGVNMKIEINANQFIECSAKTYTNINEVIYEAVRASVAGVPEMEDQSGSCLECCGLMSLAAFLPSLFSSNDD